MMKLNELLEYLRELIKLKEAGGFANEEINRTLTRIEAYFAPTATSKQIALTAESKQHPLIESSIEEWPKIKGTDVYVRDILNELAIGKTVHQLCNELSLDINQVSGAVIFAAYMCTFPVTTKFKVAQGGHIDISYVDGCKNHPDRICDCNVTGGRMRLEGPAELDVPGKL